MRTGQYVKQPTGYKAFVPAPLPPNPPVQMDAQLTRLLSEADRSLGRLDGVATILPNPNLFVAMYVRQEAVLSSQIEGTQSTMRVSARPSERVAPFPRALFRYAHTSVFVIIGSTEEVLP